MNTQNENNISNLVPEDNEHHKIIINEPKEKGDIDDYIFSWQNIKMFSER